MVVLVEAVPSLERLSENGSSAQSLVRFAGTHDTATGHGKKAWRIQTCEISGTASLAGFISDTM